MAEKYGIAESLERENAYFMAHMNDDDSITCNEPGHVPGCAGVAGGDHEWEDHEAFHPDTVEGCDECERRAEASAAAWNERMNGL